MADKSCQVGVPVVVVVEQWTRCHQEGVATQVLEGHAGAVLGRFFEVVQKKTRICDDRFEIFAPVKQDKFEWCAVSLKNEALIIKR